MITAKKFDHIKKDFVNRYQRHLCEESLVDIEAAKDWKSFAAVLRKYMVFNSYRPFPEVEWVRKWFTREKMSLNEENIYLDQIISVADPDTPVMLYGDCLCNVVYSKAGVHRVMAQDTSKINLFTYNKATVFVKLKDDATLTERVNRKGAIIKVRHYETRIDKAYNEPQWR